MEPERLQVTANGLTFGALAWGAPDAPLALLVHGYPDSAWTWRHLGPHLAERGWRAVAPFTRGYAPTELAPDDSYLVSDQAADLLALHAALGGDERAVLIGHDWGALATYAVTQSAPERFSRYVTLAIPPPHALLRVLGSRRTLRIGARQSRLSWYFLFNQLPGAEHVLNTLIPRHWRDWSPGYDAAPDLPRVFAALDTPARRRAALRYYRDNLRGGLKATFTLTPGTPVLYLAGESDGCVRPEFCTAYPDELVPGSSFIRLAGVGHFLHLEAPERVNPLIEEWICH